MLQLADGTLAPLDYKYTEYKEKVYRTHKYQIILYGLMIEDTYRFPVNRGYVCYVRKGNVVKEVSIGAKERQEAKAIVSDMLAIIQRGQVSQTDVSCRALSRLLLQKYLRKVNGGQKTHLVRTVWQGSGDERGCIF